MMRAVAFMAVVAATVVRTVAARVGGGDKSERDGDGERQNAKLHEIPQSKNEEI